jgi:hypothetical protein
MQTPPVKLNLLGKRSISQHRSTGMGMTEKNEPYEIDKKMRKQDKRKTIFSNQKKKFCSCIGKKKMCNLPKKHSYKK